MVGPASRIAADVASIWRQRLALTYCGENRHPKRASNNSLALAHLSSKMADVFDGFLGQEFIFDLFIMG